MSQMIGKFYVDFSLKVCYSNNMVKKVENSYKFKCNECESIDGELIEEKDKVVIECKTCRTVESI